MSNAENHRKQNIRYEWQSSFDQLLAEVRVEISQLIGEYPSQVVYTALLQVLRLELGNDLREEFGELHGEDYLPPPPDSRADGDVVEDRPKNRTTDEKQTCSDES